MRIEVEIVDLARQVLRGFEFTLSERAVQSEIAFKGRGAVADETEQVRHHAELLVDGMK